MNTTDGSYWLVPTSKDGRRVRLSTTAAFLVGRGEHNHLVLDDWRVSRQHSRLAPEREGYVVYDLNSVNGTTVNGVPIRRHVLAVGDEIGVGPFTFRLEFQAEMPLKKRPVEVPAKADERRWRPIESVTRMWSEEVVNSFRANLPAIDLNHLEDAYHDLGTLYSFVQAISKTIDKQELLKLICARILDVFADAIAVSVHLVTADPAASERFELAQTMGTEVRQHLTNARGEAILKAGRATFDPDAPATAMSGSVMYAPLIDRDEELGVITVTTDSRREGFSLANLQLLNGMATPATMMLQNARMHEESIVRERLRQDLELAAQIQKSFLPRETISVEGLEFLAAYRAAYDVGGDFYDVFWVGPNKLAMFIGDISGKGIAAALLMARISGELRVAALAHVDPVAVLSIINQGLLERDQPELFFTAVYLTLDVQTGLVTLANAGHPPPYLCHAGGTLEAIADGGSTAVGMFDDPSFAATTFQMLDGDSLVLYTDGVVEAADTAGRLYGQERLERCLAEAYVGPEAISGAILSDVDAHARNAKSNDDLTVFICHRRIGYPATRQPRRASGPPSRPSISPMTHPVDTLRPPSIPRV